MPIANERCVYADEPADLYAIRRRVREGTLVNPFRGMYAEAEYWHGLNPTEQAMHIIRIAEAHAVRRVRDADDPIRIILQQTGRTGGRHAAQAVRRIGIDGDGRAVGGDCQIRRVGPESYDCRTNP